MESKSWTVFWVAAMFVAAVLLGMSLPRIFQPEAAPVAPTVEPTPVETADGVNGACVQVTKYVWRYAEMLVQMLDQAEGAEQLVMDAGTAVSEQNDELWQSAVDRAIKTQQTVDELRDEVYDIGGRYYGYEQECLGT